MNQSQSDLVIISMEEKLAETVVFWCIRWGKQNLKRAYNIH